MKIRDTRPGTQQRRPFWGAQRQKSRLRENTGAERCGRRCIARHLRFSSLELRVPGELGRKVCIGSLRPLGSLPHSHSQAGLTARRQTTGLCWAQWGARGGGGGDDGRAQDALSYPPACRPKATLNSRERVLAASVYHRKFKDCHLDLLKQTTTIVENE